jgi:hypothetical protein
MPVRGTTQWRHAIIQKKVINLDHAGDKKIYCAWDTCENDGYECYMVRVNDAAPGYEPKVVKHVFCSERHKQYWVNSTRRYGYLY